MKHSKEFYDYYNLDNIIEKYNELENKIIKDLLKLKEYQILYNLLVTHFKDKFDIKIMGLRQKIINNIEHNTKNTYEICVQLYYDKITIKSETGNTHDIYDSFITLDFSFFENEITYRNFNIYRTTFTVEEILSGYVHSHSSGKPEIPLSGSVCLGEGPIKDTIKLLSTSFTEENLFMFINQIESWIGWESISGGPHRYISNLSEQMSKSIIKQYLSKEEMETIPISLWIELIRKKIIKVTYSELDGFDVNFENNFEEIVGSFIDKNNMFNYKQNVLVAKYSDAKYSKLVFLDNNINKNDIEYISCINKEKSRSLKLYENVPYIIFKEKPIYLKIFNSKTNLNYVKSINPEIKSQLSKFIKNKLDEEVLSIDQKEFDNFSVNIS